MPANQGWLLISSAPALVPSRAAGSLTSCGVVEVEVAQRQRVCACASSMHPRARGVGRAEACQSSHKHI
jgi:hypothetical protein